MLLEKTHFRPGDNSYKYYSRDKALDRLEAAINDFFDKYGAEKFLCLEPMYDELSIKDKRLYNRAIKKLDAWLQEMIPQELICEDEEPLEVFR